MPCLIFSGAGAVVGGFITSEVAGVAPVSNNHSGASLLMTSMVFLTMGVGSVLTAQRRRWRTEKTTERESEPSLPDQVFSDE